MRARSLVDAGVDVAPRRVCAMSNIVPHLGGVGSPYGERRHPWAGLRARFLCRVAVERGGESGAPAHRLAKLCLVRKTPCLDVLCDVCLHRCWNSIEDSAYSAREALALYGDSLSVDSGFERWLEREKERELAAIVLDAEDTCEETQAPAGRAVGSRESAVEGGPGDVAGPMIPAPELPGQVCAEGEMIMHDAQMPDAAQVEHVPSSKSAGPHAAGAGRPRGGGGDDE